MSEKTDRFQRFAEEARQQAEKCVDQSAEKEKWLKIAEEWERLAKEAEKKF